MGKILRREMKEVEYNSILDESHKLYSELKCLEEQINNFDEKPFMRELKKRRLQSK